MEWPTNPACKNLAVANEFLVINPSYFSLYKDYESYKKFPYGMLILLANRA
jgi:hypothetical protein